MASVADNHGQPSADELRAKLEQLQAKLNAVKIAYLNNVEFDGKAVSYEDLRQVAQDLIQTNYALQKLLYGSVKLRLSTAKLLRRGG
jgi:uncharacterized protein YfkK (UPF0435 family)